MEGVVGIEPLVEVEEVRAHLLHDLTHVLDERRRCPHGREGGGFGLQCAAQLERLAQAVVRPANGHAEEVIERRR